MKYLTKVFHESVIPDEWLDWEKWDKVDENKIDWAKKVNDYADFLKSDIEIVTIFNTTRNGINRIHVTYFESGVF